MKIGFGQNCITPKLGIELVGFLPSRRAESIEKDLNVKVICLNDNDELHVWLTVDMLGLDMFFKEKVLEKLEVDGITITSFLMFSTHTHSGPTCLSKDKYESKEEEQINKEFFDFLVDKSCDAIQQAIDSASIFTYRYAKGTMSDFQTNRINKEFFSNNEILAIEIICETKKSLIYSFAGHPTILDRSSTRISPDYIGEVAKNLENEYDFTIFFNAPCGDMSTRYTKSESSLNELIRLGKVASDCVLQTCSKMREEKVLQSIEITKLEFPLQYKTFLRSDVAQKRFDESKVQYEKAIEESTDAITLRTLRGTLEGNMINLYHSMQNYKEKEKVMHISITKIDNFEIVSFESEVFSALVKPLMNRDRWLLSLEGQYSTYLSDTRGFELSTYEALSSLYKVGEGERLVSYLGANLKCKNL